MECNKLLDISTLYYCIVVLYFSLFVAVSLKYNGMLY